MSPSARIVSLRVHPVKGCRGTELREATLTAAGLEWDRNWMFVSENGRFLSQREIPGLACIDATVSDGELMLESEGHPALRCPVEARLSPKSEWMKVTVWGDTCAAQPSEVDTRDWLNRVTGTPGRLVRGVKDQPRISNAEFTGKDRGEVFFADAYALLVTNPSSLADLNARLEEPLPMNRFRPNLVIEGLEPFAEDRVEWLRNGSMALKVVKPCTRCIVTTTDQATGERRGDEPLRTLRSFRWQRALKGVAFGMNAIVVDGVGTRLAVGDSMDVTWRRQPAAWDEPQPQANAGMQRNT